MLYGFNNPNPDMKRTIGSLTAKINSVGITAFNLQYYIFNRKPYGHPSSV